MECKLKRLLTSSALGISLIEVIVVILLLSISFGVFLQGLNSSKIVRTKAEFRMIQAVILNDLQQKIRARRFDENISSPWSTTLGSNAVSYLLTFDGINDQVLLGDIDALDGPSMITISFWFNRTQDLPANSNHVVSNIMFAKA